ESRYRHGSFRNFPQGCAGAFDRFAGFEHLALIGLTSHLSTADDPESDFVQAQRRRFERIVLSGRARGLGLRSNNISNSAGTAIHEDLHFEMVRCGIMLYGGLPNPEFISPVGLKPVMHFRARVLQLRVLEDRTPVSYGRTHYTEGNRRIAVISAGYGDGIPRRLSNRGFVLIRGKRVPVVGTICMNLTLCDVTDIQQVKVGDEVVMLGSQGNSRITGDEMAKWAETISYEIFCSIGQMNQKEYRE
ncbi:MAG: alanine racemase, partial [Deltaproteobacteria bacterium]